ncbi:unnamed protein product, partial [Discosporangium mesarthrocarpum]
MSSHRIKVELGGDIRAMELFSPTTFAGLVRAVSALFGVNITSEFKFFFKDSDGDAVRFDTDVELDLALRTSPVPLRITVKSGGDAVRSDSYAESVSSLPNVEGIPVGTDARRMDDDEVDSEDDEDDGVLVEPVSRQGAGGEESNEVGRAEKAAEVDPEGSALYQTASRRLARRHQVHLTPMQVWRVIALLRFPGRRLVSCGLAPRNALQDPATPAADDDEDMDVAPPSSPPSGSRRWDAGGRGGGPGPITP